ncbi:hypothetical protein [Streptomyces sp. NPDC058401]|uniref:hypothetical protein n=1 Tax=Streptomyces sp. NPDC058401 TaxID=3346480 RepID=UPI00364F6081
MQKTNIARIMKRRSHVDNVVADLNYNWLTVGGFWGGHEVDSVAQNPVKTR